MAPDVQNGEDEQDPQVCKMHSSLENTVVVGYRNIFRNPYTFWAVVSVTIIGAIALILTFTVFKIKAPIITLDSTHFDRVKFEIGSFRYPSSLVVKLTATTSMKNPNIATKFSFENSTINFYYVAQMFGTVYAPSGHIGPRKTTTMDLPVEVFSGNPAGQLVANAALQGGAVNVTSYTEVKGRVQVLGFYRDLDAKLNCSMTLEFSPGQQQISKKICNTSLR